MSDDDLDNDLIRAAQAGQDYASAFLVSRYGPRVLGYCRFIAPDLTDVDHERIVEIAIETAVRKIDRFDPDRESSGCGSARSCSTPRRTGAAAMPWLQSLDDEEGRISEPATDALGALLTEATRPPPTKGPPSGCNRYLQR